MSNVSAHSSGVNRRRLFIGSCVALIATSVAFATVGAIMLDLKREFVLTNAEVGWVGGAALWGFAISQVVFAPLCDKLGMRLLMGFAFVGHLVGATMMITASGFWFLFFGALIIALGNGLVEAAGNPLVATLYPKNKTVKLNQFHVWFPGGIVLGSVAAWLLDQGGIGAWEIKMALVFIPTVIYGFMLLGETFPDTENVQAGVSMREMFKATFLSPMMWLLVFCMMITASTELGPNRWIPPVLEAGGIAGILVLAYINGIMAALRYNAKPFVERLSPTGVLLASSVISIIGLTWLSYAETTAMAFASATVFAVGVCYFWPTMLGVVSERIPRSGALGLGLMGAVGNGVVGLVTIPLMGGVADNYAHQYIEAQSAKETVTVIEEVVETYPSYANQADAVAFRNQIQRAEDSARDLMETYKAEGSLPEDETANALRTIIDSRVAVEEVTNGEAMLVTRAQEILRPADNYGGRISFRYILPFTGLLVIVFGILYWRDRRSGGYEVVGIHSEDQDS
jgi:fucose permease